MNLMTISKSIGDVLYEKGIIGHVTVDLVSYPDPTSSTSHPLFWATDINCHLTDYAAVCSFFDFLMEGRLDQYTGQYHIDRMDEGRSVASRQEDTLSLKDDDDRADRRHFMFCKYINHSGLASIQYKTFFHMCRLEVSPWTFRAFRLTWSAERGPVSSSATASSQGSCPC